MDNYQVSFLGRAVKDLDSIYAYIARTLLEPGTAAGLVDAIESEILSLATMPYRYPERKAGAYAGKGYRQLFVKNYTVIYRVNESQKQVTVVTVHYSGSQF